MLHVHHAERADRLVDALGEMLATPLTDPLATEVVAVPTRGVERWLTQQLSTALGASQARADGVCGNVAFPFPGRLVGGATAAATGVDPQTDPWRPERCVWPLLDVVEDGLGERWLAPLAAHLGRQDNSPDGHSPDVSAGDPSDPRSARRFATVRRLADLFDRYAVHRPAMVRAWAAGEDADGHGEALPPDAVWQARLWRALRSVLGTPSPAERHPEACRRLGGEPGLVDLPPRLSLFGLTRLPASYLDVLDALAGSRDVHLFLLHPSPRLWARTEQTETVPPALPRRRDDAAPTPANPLLNTWGRDAREMQTVLAAGATASRRTHHALDEAEDTLLQRVQADVRADRCPPGAPLPGSEDTRPALDPGDDSVAVHACHGRARQVEVARDAILHLLADDPTLEPRDVLVMCPDIEAFAPLVQATFGGATADGPTDEPPPAGQADDEGLSAGPPGLRVRLADRSLRQTNPVLGLVGELLDLVHARLTASQVLDLAGREPVRRRFGFDDEDLSRIEQWVAAAGIRWGLDAEHRAPFAMDQLDANTWRAGLDRILLGVTSQEDGQPLFDGVLPLDEVDSTDVDLAGRLAELIDRLADAVDSLSATQPVAAWTEAISGAAQALTATAADEEWQHTQLGRVLDDLLAEASASRVRLAPAEVSDLLADRLRGRPTRANFRTGHVTVCTLVPMRSVPHRVVCLLGLDDGVFPRQPAVDGDDLVARAPRVGDRDARGEDRQLLLDAVMAATDHLLITYTGRDERTNARRPAAVPVGELLDVVDATVRLGDGGDVSDTDDAGHAGHAGDAGHAGHAGDVGDTGAAGDGAPRDRVLVHHPLQPFDARNFAAGALVDGRRWSFDRAALHGARAAAGPRRQPAAFLAGPLPPVDDELVALEDLVDFVSHPVRAFLRQRLGVSVSGRGDELDDALPVELDGVGEWALGQRLLDARLAGVDVPTARAAEQARGLLPPGALGRAVLDRVTTAVEDVVESAAAHAGANASTRADGIPAGDAEVAVDVGGGRRLVGTVPDVAGDRIRAVTYSRVAGSHRLTAWVRLLALTVARPDRPVTAVTVGRGAGDEVAVASVGPLGEDAATRAATARCFLADLVDCYDRGMREPLPFSPRASRAYAEAHRDGHDPPAEAREEWVSRSGGDGEDAEAEHVLVLGGVAGFEELLAAPPRDDEHGEDWAPDEPTRFGRYARRLWDGLLAWETVTTP